MGKVVDTRQCNINVHTKYSEVVDAGYGYDGADACHGYGIVGARTPTNSFACGGDTRVRSSIKCDIPHTTGDFSKI